MEIDFTAVHGLQKPELPLPIDPKNLSTRFLPSRFLTALQKGRVIAQLSIGAAKCVSDGKRQVSLTRILGRARRLHADIPPAWNGNPYRDKIWLTHFVMGVWSANCHAAGRHSPIAPFELGQIGFDRLPEMSGGPKAFDFKLKRGLHLMNLVTAA